MQVQTNRSRMVEPMDSPLSSSLPVGNHSWSLPLSSNAPIVIARFASLVAGRLPARKMAASSRSSRTRRIRPARRSAQKGGPRPSCLSSGRLRYPLKRTRPKTDPDPGWQRISWDEALDLTASNLRRIAAERGPESVVFGMVSASTSAISDAAPWIDRLRACVRIAKSLPGNGALRVGTFCRFLYLWDADWPARFGDARSGTCRVHALLGI